MATSMPLAGHVYRNVRLSLYTSIQSFDSKFDASRFWVANDNVPFPIIIRLKRMPVNNFSIHRRNSGPNGVRIGGESQPVAQDTTGTGF